jgi:hypothetical protein
MTDMDSTLEGGRKKSEGNINKSAFNRNIPWNSEEFGSFKQFLADI